jgi:sarcosine oxidase subunit alpha
MSQPNRIAGVGVVNRDQPLGFTFNGRELVGYAGDTIASALLANNVHLVGRSFKYHRPRGIYAAGAEEPNAIVQVDRGARTIPNLRATQVELRDGISAESVNAWPSLTFDVGVVNSWFSQLLPAGFYYKTFMQPAAMWHTYERVIRRAAGLGRSPDQPDPDTYDHMNTHCELLVVGAGPAGLAAALAAGRRGVGVLLVDEQHQGGGHGLASRERIDDFPAAQWVLQALAELDALPNVRVMLRTSVFGSYRDRFLTAVERRTDHLTRPDANVSRQRMWRIRAGEVVLATGAIERPLVFGNNDLPGVMLASAVSTYINRYGVRPGHRAIVFTNNDSAYVTALDLADAGASVVAVVDARAQVGGPMVDAVRAAGIDVFAGTVVTELQGGQRVVAAHLAALQGATVSGASRLEHCDLVAVSGGWSPVVHLHSHAGGKTVFDETRACFVPGTPAQDEVSVGAANGDFALSTCLTDGFAAGEQAAIRLGASGRRKGKAPQAPMLDESPIQALWLVPGAKPLEQRPKCFVDLQNDTSAADLHLAVREGFESIEHVKRYTALGFGTDQGKLGNINGMGIVAGAVGASPGAIGTTTFRPPYSPVTFGAVAGRHVGAMLDPVRKTAMHEWHAANGAAFENVGQWHRPWYYPRGGETMDQAVNRECMAARHGVAMLDASTLGKIDVRGPDAAEFLDRIYTNGWKKLGVGRARYGFMLGEDGMVMDDGVSARLADDHYYMTTTTGGAANVLGWMERWLQTEWPELKVFLTSVTDEWATIGVAGPHARAVLGKVCAGIDLDGDAFPFMSFRQGTVAGVDARVFRISFSGEQSYEVNVSANHGQAVWEAIYDAGRAFDITPYGTETMHVLRAEKGFVIVGQDTDGSVTPQDLGMDWIVAKHKDFLGKRSLNRSDCVRPDRKQLVGLLTDDPLTVIAEGNQLVDEPFTYLPAKMVGHVTSSYWSETLGHSIALALVKGGHARHGETIYAPLSDGRLVKATIGPTVFYDVNGARQHG